MQTLKVRHFWRIPSLNQRFKTSFDELDDTAAENGLLTEQVRFSLFFERGFDDPGARVADAF